jgi:hypothetical protein
VASGEKEKKIRIAQRTQSFAEKRNPRAQPGMAVPQDGES